MNSAIANVKHRRVLDDIVNQISLYKKDYLKDAIEFKDRFTRWGVRKEYPTNLYIGNDTMRDLHIGGSFKLCLKLLRTIMR